MTLGRRMPKPSTGYSCSSVVMQPIIMAACVSMMVSSALRLQMPPMSIGGVMLPISMARTCCMAWGKAIDQEGLPSKRSSSALVWIVLLTNITSLSQENAEASGARRTDEPASSAALLN